MEESAAASTISFAIAIAVFMAAMGGIFIATQEIGQDNDSGEAAAKTLNAESLADVLMTPGVGWESGADNLSRLGILNGNGSGIDRAHIDLLRGANQSAQANGLLDYDEASASLGVADGTNFHLRLYPTNLLEQLKSADLSHLKAAYIGGWANIPSVSTLPLAEQIVADASRDAIQTGASLISDDERTSIASLGMNFNNLIHLDYAGWSMVVDLPVLPDIPVVTYVSETILRGDVYPDDKSYLNDAFVERIDEYDLLFIGSQTNSSAYTSDVFKDSVKDWVLAGGSLIVFGSDGSNFQWLQPLFHTGTASVSGSPVAPSGHPVLSEPYSLEWASYDSHAIAWDIKQSGTGAHYNDFEHVLVDDGEDVLAISKEGAFGDGRIYLTSYRPGEIASELGVPEAAAFVNNLIIYDDYSHLFLEYGAVIPSDQAISTAVRLTHLWDDDLGFVPMRVEVLYW